MVAASLVLESVVAASAEHMWEEERGFGLDFT